MSFSFSCTVFGLILGHLLADFWWQKTAWVEDRKQNKWRSRSLYIHGVLGGLMPILGAVLTLGLIGSLTQTALWPHVGLGRWLLLSLSLVLAHTGTDLAKSYLDDNPSNFVLDQVAHLAALLVVALALHPSETQALRQLAGQHISTALLVQTLILIILTKPSSYLLQSIFRQFGLGTDTSNTLPKGGELIGIMERIIIFICIMSGNPEAIGWMVASKSILRFSPNNESTRTEYVLAGTLCSTVLAIVLSLVAKGWG